jgi:hypothetical protein
MFGGLGSQAKLAEYGPSAEAWAPSSEVLLCTGLHVAGTLKPAPSCYECTLPRTHTCSVTSPGALVTTITVRAPSSDWVGRWASRAFACVMRSPLGRSLEPDEDVGQRCGLGAALPIGVFRTGSQDTKASAHSGTALLVLCFGTHAVPCTHCAAVWFRWLRAVPSHAHSMCARVCAAVRALCNLRVTLKRCSAYRSAPCVTEKPHSSRSRRHALCSRACHY